MFSKQFSSSSLVASHKTTSCRFNHARILGRLQKKMRLVTFLSRQPWIVSPRFACDSLRFDWFCVIAGEMTPKKCKLFAIWILSNFDLLSIPQPYCQSYKTRFRLSHGLGDVQKIISEQNQHLSANPRARIDVAIRKIQTKIDEHGLKGTVHLRVDDRQFSIDT